MTGRRILVTGATGYIGSRLLRALEAGGCPVRCLARQPGRVIPGRSTTEVVAGDCLDEASLAAAMHGVEQAFYLVHSMASGPGFAALDREAAGKFGRAAARAGVRRIIYLGGLGSDPDSLSAHLKSRMETGDALREAGVAVVEFRASIVVGAGSLSFQMIRALVERLPVMICPRWVGTPTQPIAIDDVLAYLHAALDLPDGTGGVFEIGGPEVVSYGDMMREYARLRGLRRLLISVPVLTPRVSGLWLGLVTPAQARVGRALVEGVRNATVVRSLAARQAFAIRPMPMREAFVRAIEEDTPTQRRIYTRVVVVDAPPAQAFAPIRRIGGAAGWYFGDALWRLRGWLDRGMGGAGMPRHRRHPDACEAGDVIDGWRVQTYVPDRLLRLAAGLKLPGRGWLELRVDRFGGERSLIRLTATFDPKGVAGRLYWYGVLPLHALVFRGLLRRLARRAVEGGGRRRRAAASRRATAALALAAAAALQPATTRAQGPAPVRTVPFVDLDRYAGDWYEIARFPNRFQRQCVGDVRASYARRPDGRVDVLNRCRTAGGETEARGVARIADAQTSARLEVRFAPAWLSFLPAVWGDYWVIGLAPDYSWAVVGDPGRTYLWILARAPHLDDGAAAAAWAAARDNGFDVQRLVKTPQAAR
jgi:lipocalin/uncharacterized protein YbjT (DUF2867 family)